MRLNDFGPIADVYDELVSWAPYHEWVVQLEERFARYGLRNGDRILDIGCGTGLSSFPWAERGYSVVGVDHCPQMLAAAVRHAAQRHSSVQFMHLDVLALDGEDGPGRFDAAVCMHSGFDYIPDRDELQRIFAAVRSVLKEGGLFAFDKCLDAPDFYKDGYSDERMLSCGRAVIHYHWDSEERFMEQRCVVIRASGKRTEVVFRLHATPPDQLVRMVKKARFELLEAPRQFKVSDPGMGIFRAV